MIRSLIALPLILIGISSMAAGLNGDSSVIDSQSARLYGAYIGAALLAVNFIIGKFWSLNWQPKPRANAGASGFAASAEKRQEPVEEQIDLFEPRTRHGLPLIPSDLGQRTAVPREENESPSRSKQDRDRKHQHRLYDVIPQMRRVT